MKDTNNLISYNLWTGSEYENKTNDIIPNGLIITPSNEFSSIGESSFKIIRTGTNNYLSINIKNLLTDNQSYTVYVDIFSPTTDGSLLLRDVNGTNSVSYSAMESIQTVSVTKTVNLSGACYIQLICPTGPVFIDNIRLVES